MTVLAAVPDNPEGAAALAAAADEARLAGTDLVVMNLSLTGFDSARLPDGVSTTVVERSGRGDRDPAEAVLDEIRDREIDLLVIGLKRRTPVGKALLGSVSQRLLLESPVPVLAVKAG